MEPPIMTMTTPTSASPPEAPARRTRGPLINRGFALLWGGETISALGDAIFDTTLVLWIATTIARGQTWAPLAVSGALLAASVPVFLVGPLAGVFADRWDRRRTMLWMDVARAALIALLILATGIVPLPFAPGGHLPTAWQLGAIYGTVALASICAQFFNPARMSLLGLLVDQPAMARAAGMTQAAASIAGIAGPPVAALLFFAGGIEWALLANALSFAVSFAAILAIRPASIRQATGDGVARDAGETAPTGFWREFAAGVRFFTTSRPMLALLVTGVLVLLGAGALNTLDIFFLQTNLHAAPGLYGVLTAAEGVGLVVGAVLAAAFAERIGVARTFSWSLIAAGIVTLVYARMTSFPPALAALVVFGLLIAAVNVSINTLLFLVTPQELIGRVTAVFNPVTSLASMLSIALAGYLDSVALRGLHLSVFGMVVGPVDAIYMGVGVLILLGGLNAALNLRGARAAARAGAE
jgi:MFS family permease